MLYLASPYTHPTEEMMQLRYEQALFVSSELLKKGVTVYSPIFHFHPMAQKFFMPRGYSFWMKHNKAAINVCTALAFLTLDGWRKSTGVKDEVTFSLEENKPLYRVDITDLGEIEISQALTKNPFTQG